MTRAELLKSPDYWKTRIQIALYDCAASFMKKTHKNRKQLAEYLGVSNGYVTQVLNGDYDHKLSKLTELSLSFGFVPHIEFIPVEQFIDIEHCNLNYNHFIGKSNYSFNVTQLSCKKPLTTVGKYWCVTEKQKIEEIA